MTSFLSGEGFCFCEEVLGNDEVEGDVEEGEVVRVVESGDLDR